MNYICIIRHAYFPDDPRDRKQAYALVESGFSVDIICLKKKGQATFEIINGVRVYRIPLSHKRTGIPRYLVEYAVSFFIMSIMQLWLFIFKRYNCIQVSTMPDFLVFTTIIPKILGAKVLLDLRDPMPELWEIKYGDRFRILLSMQKLVENLAIRYSNKCTTVTEMFRKRLGKRGSNLKKIDVIPNVCEETFHCILPKVHKKSGPYKNKFHIVTHGLIEARYGHELVINALNLLRKEYPDIHYTIIGEGEYCKKLNALVNRLDFWSNIHFTGYIPFKELLQKLIDADAGVIPMLRSPYSEMIETNKMYELIALRKPIICSRLPVIEDNFDDSCMMFFEPGNIDDLSGCIVGLYNNSMLRKNLVNNSFQIYEKIQWGITKKAYIKAIIGLCPT